MRRSNNREEKAKAKPRKIGSSILFGEEEPKERVHKDAHRNEVEDDKEIDPDGETVNGDNNEEEEIQTQKELKNQGWKRGLTTLSNKR